MNGGRRLLVASVISIQNSNFVYPSCQNCFSRLSLDLKRYSCLKCGCTGDAKDANYRYRLSLEVTDAHDLFEVTVFGSCLDAYFGVTAKGLQRYIEEVNQELDRDASPDVLIKAVETCFIGKKFVFGVKFVKNLKYPLQNEGMNGMECISMLEHMPCMDSSKQDGASFVQNPYQTESKALTACQMFVPNSGLVGHTVIHYVQQEQCSLFKHHHRGFGPPRELFAALDQPSIELSSLHSSGGLGAIPSQQLDTLSSLWPQSFGLTSSSTSGGTPADPTTLSSGKTACEEQKWGNSPVSVHSRSVPNPQDSHLIVNKRNLQGDHKPHLSSTWCDNLAGKSEPKSHSSLARKGCRSLESLLELEENGTSGETSIQQRCGPEKAWSPLLCQKLSYSFGSLVPSSHTRAGGNSQDHPWFEDELPSSENLTEFLARIENQASVLPTEVKARECSTSKGTDVCHRHFDQSSSKPGVFDAYFLLDLPVEKVEVWREDDPPHHACNLPSLRGKESQQQAFDSSLPTERKEELNYLPKEHRILSPWPSLAAVKPHSKGTCLSARKGADQDVSNLKNLHSSSSLKSTSNCQESLCLQTRKKATRLNCGCDNGLANWGNQGGSSCQLSLTADPTNVQEQGFPSVASEEANAVCAREKEALPEMQGNNSIGSNVSGLLQGSSACPQDSYNGSADLFDISARGAEAALRMLDAAQLLPVQENAQTERQGPSEFLPSELDAAQKTSLHGLTLRNLHATSDQKLSTLLGGSASEPEHNLEGTLDFVPYSQPTPLAKPRQQARLPRAKESILRELTLNTWSRVDAKCKRPRPSFRSPVVKQLVGEFLQSRRLSNVDSSPIDTTGPRQLFIDASPAQELSENYSEEWIPPSERKQMQPLAPQNPKIFGLRSKKNLIRNFADYQIPEPSPFSENRVGCGIGLKQSELALRKEQSRQAPIGTVPIPQDAANLWQEIGPSSGFCTFAIVNKSNLTSTPRSMSNAASWSPELFVDNNHLPSPEAVFSNPSP